MTSLIIITSAIHHNFVMLGAVLIIWALFSTLTKTVIALTWKAKSRLILEIIMTMAGVLLILW